MNKPEIIGSIRYQTKIIITQKFEKHLNMAGIATKY